MGVKVSRGSSELHPEGLFLFRVKDCAESRGKFGLQIRWMVQSTEDREDGEKFVLFYYTGTVVSDHEDCKITRLIQACGMDEEEFEDSDELIDGIFCGRVEHSDDGRYADIVKVFPASKLQGKPDTKAKAKAKAEGRKKDYSDPFEDE